MSPFSGRLSRVRARRVVGERGGISIAAPQEAHSLHWASRPSSHAAGQRPAPLRTAGALFFGEFYAALSTRSISIDSPLLLLSPCLQVACHRP
jgi:hypothetical protein